jgi:hypothetical protein
MNKEIDELESILNFKKPAFTRLRVLKNNMKFKMYYMAIQRIIYDFKNINYDLKYFIGFIVKNDKNYKENYPKLIELINEYRKYQKVSIFKLSDDEFRNTFLSLISKINYCLNSILLEPINTSTKYIDSYISKFDLIGNKIKIVIEYEKRGLNYKNINEQFINVNFIESVTDLENLTIYEKHYMSYLFNSFESLNLINIFNNFEEEVEKQINYEYKKFVSRYERAIDQKFLYAYQQLDESISSDVNLLQMQINEKLKLNTSSAVMEKIHQYFDSPEYHTLIDDKVKNNNTLFKKVNSIMSKAKSISRYPNFVTEMPLFYKKIDNTLCKLSLDREFYYRITINDILEHRIHSTVTPYDEIPGSFYSCVRYNNGEVKFNKMNFYKSYRSLVFNYDKIPKNIFWSRKKNFYVTTKYFINIFISFKKSMEKSNIPSVPLEMIEMILSYISINDMCKHYPCKKGELFG